MTGRPGDHLQQMSAMHSSIRMNKFRSTTAAERSFAVKHHSMNNHELSKRLTAKSLPGDIDYKHHSHATRFARGGIIPGHGINRPYARDPVTGAWFPDDVAKRKTMMHTGDEVSIRYHDPNGCPAKSGEHGVAVWSAPCGGNFWSQRAKPKAQSLASTGRTFSEPW
eukprot:CAMPEP_0176233006 /NCGR_PEP_ID=MMETSP0121_2-20121125/25600_1 /TAXON_ID=160619 /ORGANISM="Kryptoperidinium foliaceum, Strain CCMP 1326" /LENGTH=165 /DNA_ID=CAMNT_0017572383 /DNA_START=102 /DNA_END=596 /DNA_ORIENTATION=+